MTGKMLRRAEAIARERQVRALSDIAERLREIVRDAAVEIEGTQVVVRGRGLLRRWLSDAELRFFAGTFK